MKELLLLIWLFIPILSFAQEKDAPPVVAYPIDNSRRQLLITDLKRNTTWALSAHRAKYVQGYYDNGGKGLKYISGWLTDVSDSTIRLGRKPNYLIKNIKYIERVNYPYRVLAPLYVCAVLAVATAWTLNPQDHVLPNVALGVAGAFVTYQWTFNFHRGKARRRPVGTRMQVATYDPYQTRIKIFEK